MLILTYPDFYLGSGCENEDITYIYVVSLCVQPHQYYQFIIEVYTIIIMNLSLPNL